MKKLFHFLAELPVKIYAFLMWFISLALPFIGAVTVKVIFDSIEKASNRIGTIRGRLRNRKSD